jgi:hypothetical protein
MQIDISLVLLITYPSDFLGGFTLSGWFNLQMGMKSATHDVMLRSEARMTRKP